MGYVAELGGYVHTSFSDYRISPRTSPSTDKPYEKTSEMETKALFTLQLLTKVEVNLGSTWVQPTFVYTILTAKCRVNAKLG